MKYIATIKHEYNSTSMMFPTVLKAEQWLDENNNNLENTTMIEEYDDNWNKIGGFVYTEAKNENRN